MRRRHTSYPSPRSRSLTSCAGLHQASRGFEGRCTQQHGAGSGLSAGPSSSAGSGLSAGPSSSAGSGLSARSGLSPALGALAARATRAAAWLGLCASISGCGLAALTENDGSVVVHGTHHGEPRSGTFPELTGQSGAREFKSDTGWYIALADAIIMTTEVELMRCPSGGASDEDESEDDESSSSEDEESATKQKDSETEDEDSATKQSSEADSESEDEDSESKARIARTRSDEIPEDGEWLTIPLTNGLPEMISDQEDMVGVSVAAKSSIAPGSYCWVRLTFGEFEEPEDEDEHLETEAGNPVPKSIFDKTAYVVGNARRSKDSDPIRFRVALSGEITTVLDVRESAGEPLVIRASRQPVSLMISKVYDRFFDGVDFSSGNFESKLKSALRNSLKNDTYVSVGSRPSQNLAKSAGKDD